MSLSSCVAYNRALSYAFRWITLVVALLFSGCRSSGILSMEEASHQYPPAPAPFGSPIPLGTDGDVLPGQSLLLAPATSSGSSAGGAETPAALFTDRPTFLRPRACQICDAVTTDPGTARRVPYVVPLGWRGVSARVHVASKTLEFSDLDYQVELLPKDFSYRGVVHQGLLLCISVPATHRSKKRVRRAVTYETKPVTRPLKIELEVYLADKSSASEEIGGTSVGSFTVGSTLTAPVPSSDRLLSIAFGAAAWKKYFGVDVGEAPVLPDNIEDILNSTSPFLLEDESVPQRVGDNHLLTLIPGRINGEAFTLDKLGELMLRNYKNYFAALRRNNKSKLGWNSNGYLYYSDYLTNANRRTPLEDAPYWVLLPKTILQGSRDKAFSQQKEMVAQYRSNGYQLPLALEVATSLLAHYARSSGKCLYAKDNEKGRWTFTRCSDVDRDGDPLVVGGFAPSGFYVNFYSQGDGSFEIGTACVWKFKPLGLRSLV